MHNGIIKRIGTAFANLLIDFSVGLIITLHPEWSPRVWSNRELRRLAGSFKGTVLNVSAMKDGDKDGGHYRDYFPNAESYTITNYEPETENTGIQNEKQLDISIPYDGSLGRFDVVFSHTVLEHVYPDTVSIQNLCNLSKDVIIIVSPFIQGMHGEDGVYSDYYRFTPLSLTKMLEEQGFSTVYSNWNDDHGLFNVYIIHVATRYPERYKGVLPPSRKLQLGVNFPGNAYSKMLWPVLNGGEKNIIRRFGEWLGQIAKER